jgi:hypothetical protein
LRRGFRDFGVGEEEEEEEEEGGGSFLVCLRDSWNFWNGFGGGGGCGGYAVRPLRNPLPDTLGRRADRRQRQSPKDCINTGINSVGVLLRENEFWFLNLSKTPSGQTVRREQSLRRPLFAMRAASPEQIKQKPVMKASCAVVARMSYTDDDATSNSNNKRAGRREEAAIDRTKE